jgi:ABC-type dipeptide/oligopeptide/nickel transport system permease subunit
MNEVKRVCKKGAKIALGLVVGVGLIGFVKGLFVGYFIGHYKDKCSCHSIIRCTDRTDEEQK